MAIKTLPTDNARFYADLGSLKDIQARANSDEPEALRQVAKQFEQLFMNEMLKSMRKANEAFSKDSPFNTSEIQFYQGMLDNQLALEMTRQQGIGLSDLLVKQLSRQVDVRVDKEDEEASVQSTRAEQLLNRVLGQGASQIGVLPGQGSGLSEAPPSVTSIEETIAELSTRQTVQAAVASAEQPPTFETPEAFVSTLLPLAQRAAQQLGVDPKMLLAQSALETGWGKHIIAKGEGSSYNLFNIKADARWQGERAQVNTLEYRNGIAQQERASFRAYDSYAESFADYVAFIQDNPRYQQALESVQDPKAYVQQLQQAGYATDPRYASKIADIFENRILAMSIQDAKEG